MKAAMIALAAVATLSVSAPAFAAAKYDSYADQQRQSESAQYSGLSEHCQQVLNNPDMWGDKEIKYCQSSL